MQDTQHDSSRHFSWHAIFPSQRGVGRLPCLAVLQYNCVQPKTSIDDAMEEAKMVTCGAVEGLLKKQGMYPYRPHGCGLK